MFIRNETHIINTDRISVVEQADEAEPSQGAVIWFDGKNILVPESVDELWDKILRQEQIALPVPMDEGENPEDYLNRIMRGGAE